MKKLLIILLLFSSAKAQVYSSKVGLFIKSDSVIYGYNGVWNGAGLPLSNANVLDSLKTLPLLNIFRYPGGEIANSFDWRDGLPDDNTGRPCTLDDLRVLIDSVHCDILFVLNMLTKTLTDQLEMLSTAEDLGIPIKYVELGNELNSQDGPGHIKFPEPEDYADTAAVWMAAIKSEHPGVLVTVVGGNKPSWAGGRRWNDVMITINPDALSWHVGPNVEDFSTNGVADMDLLNTAILYDYYKSGMDKVTIPIWVTECNYHYDPDNLLTSDSEVETIAFLLEKVSELMRANNHNGTKIFCLRGIENSKQGAFEVTNLNITRRGTAYAMEIWSNILTQTNY